MDEISPFNPPNLHLMTSDMEKQMSANLFKNHPVPMNKGERLRTCLRIRPLDDKQNSECFKVMNSTVLIALPPKESNTFKNEIREEDKAKKYTFSQIFDQNADQITIYNNCALPLVNRFLNGDNCLLFVYGITSSGKSFTMSGNHPQPGIIPRSFKTIFEAIGDRIFYEPTVKPTGFCEIQNLSESELKDEINAIQMIEVEMDSVQNVSNTINSLFSSIRDSISVLENTNFVSNNCYYSLWVSFVEFYNEKIIDLLEEDQTKVKQLPMTDVHGNYFIKGLRYILVTSAQEAYKVFLYGKHRLHISNTALNKTSSRSHCSFNIRLVKFDHKLENVLCVNNISFCDLAGSERSKKANTMGERQREAGKINASLLTLGRCISDIRFNQKNNRQKRIPFKDSKLTKIFQPFLTGNGISNMIVTINPTPDMFDETLVALNFSAVASEIYVSNDIQKKNINETLKRLTQMWMQSTERWSIFDNKRPYKPSFPASISDIRAQFITEEDEDEEVDDEDYGDVNISYENAIKTFENIDLDELNSQELENLRSQVEYLSKQLQQANNERFDLEMQIRREVACEFNKIVNDYKQSNENSSNHQAEEMMEKRFEKLKKEFKEMKTKLQEKINKLENELFNEKEKNCLFEELKKEKCDLDIKNEQLLIELTMKDQVIEKIENNCLFEELKKEKCELDIKNEQLLIELAMKNQVIEKMEKNSQFDDSHLEKIQDELKAQFNNQVEDLKSQFNMKIEELEKEKSDLNSKNEELLENLQVKNVEIERIEKEKSDLVNQKDELANQFKLKNNEIEEIRQNFNSDLSNKNKQIEQLEREKIDLQNKNDLMINDLKATIEELKNMNSNLIDQNDEFKKELNFKNAEIDEIEKYKSHLNNKIENLLKELKSKDEMIKDVNSFCDAEVQTCQMESEEQQKKFKLNDAETLTDQNMSTQITVSTEPINNFQDQINELIKPIKQENAQLKAHMEFKDTIIKEREEEIFKLNTKLTAEKNALRNHEKQKQETAEHSIKKKDDKRANTNENGELDYLKTFSTQKTQPKEQNRSSQPTKQPTKKSSLDDIGNLCSSTIKTNKSKTRKRRGTTESNEDEDNKVKDDNKKIKMRLEEASKISISPIIEEQTAKRVTRSRARKKIFDC